MVLITFDFGAIGICYVCYGVGGFMFCLVVCRTELCVFLFSFVVVDLLLICLFVWLGERLDCLVTVACIDLLVLYPAYCSRHIT